ncbi:TPA: homocysteine S-methyltransferase family protein, partial [Burkholderia contaminans]
AMGAAIETVQCTLARTGASLAVGAYANAFPPQRADARANEELHALRGDIDPPGYAKWAEQWLALGAQIVGGCCGIGPGHIAALRDAVDARGARGTGFGE